MFCPNCGNQFEPNVVKCNKCGYYFVQQNNISNVVNEASTTPLIKNKKPPYSKIFLIILIVAIIGIAFYFGKGFVTKDNTNNNEQSQNLDSDFVVPSSDGFLFLIEDVFTISGRGTVVTGRVERGNIKVGDEIEIIGFGEKKRSIIDSIEIFRKQVEEANVGDNAGLILRDISREEVQRGQVLAKVDSIGLHSKFNANIFLLTKAEGGKPELVLGESDIHFYIRTTDSIGKINTIKKVEPKLNFEDYYTGNGETFEIRVSLENSFALEVGTTFSLREGGRTIGGGIITEIVK